MKKISHLLAFGLMLAGVACLLFVHFAPVTFSPEGRLEEAFALIPLGYLMLAAGVSLLIASRVFPAGSHRTLKTAGVFAAVLLTFYAVGALVSLTGSSTADQYVITTESYESVADESTIKVHHLEDGGVEVHFMDNGDGTYMKAFTATPEVSASGARYRSDDGRFVFWNQGSEALILEGTTGDSSDTLGEIIFTGQQPETETATTEPATSTPTTDSYITCIESGQGYQLGSQSDKQCALDGVVYFASGAEAVSLDGLTSYDDGCNMSSVENGTIIGTTKKFCE